MLSNLDNEVIFKKAFTNKIVFNQFVKDIIGIDAEFDKIETEKKFDDKVGFIDIKFDIFSESVDNRVIVEIQKIEYDYNFDRFLNYFLSAIIEQQKSSKKYKIKQTVYTIVVLTSPYNAKTIDGDWIKDEVLLSKLNPETLLGEERKVFNHQLYFLNPNYRNDKTPQRYKDWLDLIYESIHNPQTPHINKKNKGIKKAVDLIDFENLTNEERSKIKQEEGKKIVIKIERDLGKEEGKNDGLKEKSEQVIINGNKEGLSSLILSKLTGLTIGQVEEIIKTKTHQKK